ncbi:MAG: ATP-binding protein [Myxococcota bacterium]
MSGARASEHEIAASGWRGTDRPARGGRDGLSAWLRRSPLREFARLLLPARHAPETDDDWLRARIMLLVSIVGAAGLFVAIVVSPPAPSPAIRATSWMLLAMFASLPVLFRLGLGLAPTRSLLLLGMCVYATHLALATGGHDTGALFVAMQVPLVGTLVGGLRAGVGWSLALAAAFCAVGWATQSGFEAPTQLDADAVARWNLWAAAIGIVLALAIAAAYEVLRGHLERRLREEKAQAEALRARQHEIDRRFQTELHALVEERTEALAESQRELRHVERLASIGTLAAGIAHQINNPVGGILLGAQVALGRAHQPGLDPEWRETFRQIERDALRCARITRALLRFSADDRAEQRRQDLADIVELALDSLRGVLTSRDFERLEVVRPDRPLPVHASAIELEQVVVNLVQNAVEATRDVRFARTAIRIACAHGDAEVRLRVQDAGPGIPAELRTRIFDPFYTSRAREGGTGLGLSVVHGIVQSHGGSIRVAEAEDGGAVFEVCLPMAREATEVETPGSADDAGSGTDAPSPACATDQPPIRAAQRSGEGSERSAVAARP